MRIRFSFYLRIRRVFLWLLRWHSGLQETNSSRMCLFLATLIRKHSINDIWSMPSFVESIKCSSDSVSANFWSSRIVITSLDATFHRISSHCREVELWHFHSEEKAKVNATMTFHFSFSFIEMDRLRHFFDTRFLIARNIHQRYSMTYSTAININIKLTIIGVKQLVAHGANSYQINVEFIQLIELLRK